MSDDSLMVEGRKYLSSKRSAELLGYSADYIGELCRRGRVDSLKRGRQWYAEEQSLFRHLEKSREQSAERKHELSLHLSRQLGKPSVFSIPRETRRISWGLPARIGKFFSSRRLLRAGVGSLLIVAIFFAQTPVARAGLEEFSLASILRITRSVTDDLAVSFNATLQETASSLSAAAVLSRDRVLDTFDAAKATTEGVASSFHKASVSVSSALGGVKSAVMASVRGAADSLSAAVFSTEGALRTNLLAAIQYEDTFNLFRTGVQNIIDATVERVTSVLGGSTTPKDESTPIGSESGSGGGSTSVTPSIPVQTETKTIPERIIERIVRVETPVIQNVTQEAPSTRVVGGISAATLDLRLQQVSNELRAEISRVSGSSAAQVSNVFQVIGQATRIDSLSNTVITSPSISGGTISGASLTNSTSISNASISALTIGSATTTASNGIDLSAGCFAVNGTCIGSGGVAQGTVGQLPFYNSAGATLSATSSIYLTQGGNIGIGTTSPAVKLGVQGNALISGTATVANLIATGTVTFANGLSATNGGTGQTTFTTGDILYASGANTLSKLAAGSNGQVLKLSGGVPSWAADLQGGGGGGGLFATTTNDMVIYPVDTTDILVLGNNATSTTGTIFEVTGNTRLIGELRVTGSTTLQNLMVTNVTSTNATTTSSFATTASSTNLFTSNFTLGRVSGFLKATAGAVATSLINLTSDVTGILPTANGGTGWGAFQANAILIGNGTGAIATTTSGTDGQVLALVGGVPTWQSTTTLANISGTLSVAKGGTGQTSFAQGWLTALDNGTLTASTSPTVNYITSTSTTATSTFAAGIQTTALNVTGATSTFANGIQLASGCFRLPDGTCAGTGGGGGSGTVNSGTQGQLSYYAANGTAVSGTSQLFLTTGNLFGIGSTTPFAKLAVNPVAGDTNQFVVGSSTATSFLIDNAGKVGVGTTSPGATFSVQGNSLVSGTLGVSGAVTLGTALTAANGGTGQSSYSTGDILYASGASTLTKLAAGTNGFVLGLSGGVPAWVATTTLSTISGSLNVGTQVTGTLTVSNGGTGATTFGQGWIYSAGGTGALAASTSPTVNYIVSTSTTATSTFAAGIQTTALNITGTATSTFANGIQLAAGCFRDATGSCVGGSSLTGTAGQIAYFSGTNVAAGTSSLFISSAGLVGIGTTSPYAKLSVAAVGGDTATTLFQISSSTAAFATSSLFSVFNNGNIGVGTTSPFARFAINPIAGDVNQFVVGSSTATNFIITNAGKVGIGLTAPSTKLDVFEANSVAQLRLSKSASLYSELTVDSTGDLQVSAAGGDIRALTENLWICDGGSCPALTATSTAGNIFVENAVTFGNGFSFRQISVNELGLYNASSSLLMIFDQGN